MLLPFVYQLPQPGIGSPVSGGAVVPGKSVCQLLSRPWVNPGRVTLLRYPCCKADPAWLAWFVTWYIVSGDRAGFVIVLGAVVVPGTPGVAMRPLPRARICVNGSP